MLTRGFGSSASEITQLIERHIMGFEEDEGSTSTGKVVQADEGFIHCIGVRGACLNSIVKVGNQFGYVVAMERNLTHVAMLQSPAVAIDSTVELLPTASRFNLPRQSTGRIESPAICQEDPTTIYIRSCHGFLKMKTISKQLWTGILPMDCMSPIGFGQRVGLSGSNMSQLRQLAVQIIKNQQHIGLIDHSIYVSVGQETPYADELVDLGATVVTTKMHDTIPVQARGVDIACEMAQDIVEQSGKNVLMVFDNLNSIGGVLASLESRKSLSRNGIQSPWSMVHKSYLEKLGCFNNNSSITALCLIHTDNSNESEKFTDALSGQVDMMVGFESSRNFQLNLMGEKPPFSQVAHQGPLFSELAIVVRRTMLDLAKHENNNFMAKQLGLDHRQEDDRLVHLNHAANMRSVFESGCLLTSPASKPQVLVSLFLAAHGYLEQPPLPAVEYVQRVTEIARSKGSIAAVNDETSQLSKNPTLVALLHEIATYSNFM